MRRGARLLILLAGLCPAAQGGHALAQKPLPQQKPVYEQYEPNRILRTGRQECMNNEDAVGAYCVRICQKGYVSVPDSDPPRCRSIEPLPPGQAAGPIRVETAPLPKSPASQQPSVPSGKY